MHAKKVKKYGIFTDWTKPVNSEGPEFTFKAVDFIQLTSVDLKHLGWGFHC